MSYFSFEGLKIYYEVHGAGPKTLLILNGLLMRCSSWRPFIKSLQAQSQTQVVLVDLIDQGKSDAYDGETPYTLMHQAKVVQALVAELRLTNIHLLGMSYGGRVALLLATQQMLCIEKLILAHTQAQPLYEQLQSWQTLAESGDGKAFYNNVVVKMYAPGFLQEGEAAHVVRERLFVKAFDAASRKRLIRLLGSIDSYDLTEELYRIKVPVLLITGDQDALAPASQQRALAASIAHGAAVVLEGCGHASLFEQPVRFISTVLSFINREKPPEGFYT